MNSSWFKANLTLTIAGGVFLVLLGAGVWMVHDSMKRNNRLKRELDAAVQEVSSLIKGNPLPSQKNLERARQDREKLDEIYRQLQSASLRPVELPVLRNIEFAALLGQKIQELRKSAKDAKVGIPDQFAFGFAELLTVLPPDDKDAIEHLTKELLVVEKLSKLLVSNRVNQIDQIRRLDTAAAPGTAGKEGAPGPSGLYQTTAFELQFVCSTTALQSFLNSLSKANWFFIVRNVSITSKHVQLNVPAGGGAAVPAAPAARGARGPVAPARGPVQLTIDPATGLPVPGSLPPGGMPPGGMPAVAPPPEEMRKVERDLLSVTMKVDLVEFSTHQRKPPTK